MKSFEDLERSAQDSIKLTQGCSETILMLIGYIHRTEEVLQDYIETMKIIAGENPNLNDIAFVTQARECLARNY